MRATGIPSGVRMGGFSSAGKGRLASGRSHLGIAAGGSIELHALAVVAQPIDGSEDQRRLFGKACSAMHRLK